MNLKPTNDNIIIELESERVTDSGIIVVATKDQKLMRGQVVAVGPGRYEEGVLVPMSVKPGNIVLFERPFDLDDKKIEGNRIIIKEENILAVVE